MNKPEFAVENTCVKCGWTTLSHDYLEKCPKCGEEVEHNRVFICECGERVDMTSNYNECPKCGKTYNAFGQELAPIEEWDENDIYGTFGPQNDQDY